MRLKSCLHVTRKITYAERIFVKAKILSVKKFPAYIKETKKKRSTYEIFYTTCKRGFKREIIFSKTSLEAQALTVVTPF